MKILLPMRMGDLWGYVNARGEEVIAPQFSIAAEFSDGLAAASKDNIDLIIIDEMGQKVGVVSKAWTLATFSCGLLGFDRNGWTGYCDEHGNEVIPPRFNFGGPFVDDQAIVEIGGKAGTIDRRGEYVIEPGFLSIWQWKQPFTLTSARTLTGKPRYVIVDSKGKIRGAQRFNDARTFAEGVIPVGFPDNGKMGWIDGNLNTIVAGRFDEIDDECSGGTLAVAVDGRWGVVDPNAKWLLPPTFTSLGTLTEGRRLAYSGGGRDENGHLVGGHFGYLDEHHKWAIHPVFVNAFGFRNGIAYVYFDEDHFGYIDSTGAVIWRDP